MATGKRLVEVFTAGCPLCEPAVEMVKRVACSGCDVTVHNTKDDPKAAARAIAAGVTRVPMVLVDGIPAACCGSGPVTEEGLRAAGIGVRWVLVLDKDRRIARAREIVPLALVQGMQAANAVVHKQRLLTIGVESAGMASLTPGVPKEGRGAPVKEASDHDVVMAQSV